MTRCPDHPQERSSDRDPIEDGFRVMDVGRKYLREHVMQEARMNFRHAKSEKNYLTPLSEEARPK